MTSTDETKLAVRSPAELISAVPYLLGFHPTESLVVVATHAKRVVFVARGDLADSRVGTTGAAGYFADVLARQDADAVVIIGYGPAGSVTPVVDAVRAELHRADLPVLDVLRVTDGRYWSYLCDSPGCCPPEGTPFDQTSSVIAAAATFAGQVALPDRDALVRQLAPVTGAGRASMRRATRRARRRLADLLSGAPPVDPERNRAIEAAGQPVVRAALDRHHTGGCLTDDEAAWLSVLLTQLPVRDLAWERTGPEQWQLELWSDLLRRAEPELIPAPATLLAFSAWRAGQGALATVAVQRALDARSDYSMALLMDDVLRRAVPPTMLDWPGPGPTG